MTVNTLPFVVADVFSSTPYKGNPLAIVSTLAIELPLSKSQYQHIAHQFNLSETTFFSKPSNPKAHFALRSFLPDGREVFGAGHNILGVWWYLASAGFLTFEESNRATDHPNAWIFWQELGGEILPVTIFRDNNQLSVSIRQAHPKSHAIHPDIDSLAQVIGLQASDIGLANSSHELKPQIISTSTTKHLHVPISSETALSRIVSIEKGKLIGQLALADSHAYGLYLFAKVDGQKNSYEARFFSPGMSAEDPATGSAAGPLSLYLYEHDELDLIDGSGSITVKQGLRVGRECLIHVTLSQDKDGVKNVDFSGTGVIVSTGDIVIPDKDLSF
jgi:PhzF family phenazine biosynthesis protein